MKIFREKKLNTAAYEKRCTCCGRKFKATYPMSDFYSFMTARDIVNSNYNAHKMFCGIALSNS